MGKRTNTAKWKYKNGRWCWHIRVCKDGKPHDCYDSTPGTKGQRACNQKADDWLDDGIVNGNTKVEKLYDMWIEDLETRTGTGHARQYKSFGENWIKPQIGHLKISKVGDDEGQGVINNAFKKGNDGKGMAQKSLKNILNCYIAFIKYCRKRKKATKYIPDLEEITIPTTAAVGERTILQPEDIIKVFSCTDTVLYKKVVFDRYVHMYRLYIVLGPRPGELIAAQTKRDVKDGSLIIRESINIDHELTGGKNKNARRKNVLHEIAQGIIEDQKAMLKAEGPISKYLFPDQDGFAVKEENLLRRWHKFTEYNKITRCTLYELRHTFISMGKSLPISTLKKYVGHGLTMDTLKQYGHDVNGEDMEMAKSVGGVFKEIIGVKVGVTDNPEQVKNPQE